MRFLWLAALLLTIPLLCVTCQSSSTRDASGPPAPPQPTTLTGQQLAQTYCASCHALPDPALLDKKTWRVGVLPQMALRLGQSMQQMQALGQFSDQAELTRLIEANIFPEQPTLAPTDWQKIVDYYTTQAPDSLPAQPAHSPLRTNLSLFRPESSTRSVDAQVTLLRYDSTINRVWAGTQRGQLVALDQSLRRVDSVQFSSPPVDLHRSRNGTLDVLLVGVLNPNDRLAGSWGPVNTQRKTVTPPIQQLNRPVQVTTVDLNRDGRNDQLIAQFGHYLGKLSWFEQTADGYREHVLDPVPGARQTIVRDLNADGWPDILALLTQGDEQIAAYYNQHDGTFRKTVLLRFPPVYGSSFIELADIDKDGAPDLIYTNGDNADYSIIAKPYHGVRIFRNDGRFRFRQQWFYPLYGATQTLARDFDNDGDLDLATIAQFPDYDRQPNASFAYFENKGNWEFVPQTFANNSRGRWLTLEAGDVDQDGDLDLLLGSFFRPTHPRHADLMNQWRQPGAGVLLLRNKLR